jgi:hypothetical protein
VKNSTQLIKDLQEIPYDQNVRLASFDITDMYTNIPTQNLMAIISKIGQDNQVDNNILNDIIKLTNTIMNQNYLQFTKDNYIQTEGLAMGAPTSAIHSEIYLQSIENSTIYNIPKHTI